MKRRAHRRRDIAYPQPDTKTRILDRDLFDGTNKAAPSLPRNYDKCAGSLFEIFNPIVTNLKITSVQIRLIFLACAPMHGQADSPCKPTPHPNGPKLSKYTGTEDTWSMQVFSRAKYKKITGCWWPEAKMNSESGRKKLEMPEAFENPPN